MSEGVLPSSLEAALASHRPNFNHHQQESHIHNTVEGQELDPNSRLQSYSNIDIRNTNISDGVNNQFVPDGQINNEEVFLGAACSNVVGEPPPTSKNSTSTKHLDKEKSVKTEPYSKNTVMTIDTENTDSRLINFKDGFNFEEHYQEWSTNIILKCGDCGIESDGFHASVDHMGECHPQYFVGDKQAICIFCLKAFGRKDHLKNHVWRHVNKVHESTLYGPEGRKGDHRSLGGPGRGSSGWSEEFICVCIRCDPKEEFKGITNFSEHMLTFHLDVGIVCPVCDKQPFNSKKLLKTHLILHTDRKACCPQCPKEFTDDCRLRRHIREVHDQTKEHICATCGKSFTRADKLRQHELIHVAKVDKPLEWVTIQSTVPVVQSNVKIRVSKSDDASSSDESSDSSDEDIGRISSSNSIIHANVKKIKSEDISNEVSNIKSNEVNTSTKSFVEEPIRKEHEWKHEIRDNLQEKKNDVITDFPSKDSTIFDETRLKKKYWTPKRRSNQDWSHLVTFTCNVCNLGVVGFHPSVEHMREDHPETSEGDRIHCCIFCSKAFGRKDHLKNHVYSHVKTMPTELLPPAVRDQFLYGNLTPKKASFPEKRFWRPSTKMDGTEKLETDGEIKKRKKRKQTRESDDLVNEENDQIDIEHIEWKCRRCNESIIGFTKLVCHNEICSAQEETGFGCPVCKEISPDDPALKNHILDIHLQPELLDIKQESDVGADDDEENTRSTEYDDTEENEGKKKKKRGRPSARKAANTASLIDKDTEDGDIYSFGSHFLDGYGGVELEQEGSVKYEAEESYPDDFLGANNEICGSIDHGNEMRPWPSAIDNIEDDSYDISVNDENSKNMANNRNIVSRKSKFTYREDNDSMRESSSQDDLDDEEYGKPKTSLKKRKMKKMLKKKRKRKLGRKPSAVLKEEFSDLPEFERPNGGWVQEYHFQCKMCTNQLDDDGEGNKEPSSIVGFEASVDHMTEKHSSLVSPDKQFQCIMCDSVFTRKDHLKRHVYGHVVPRIKKPVGRPKKHFREDEDLEVDFGPHDGKRDKSSDDNSHNNTQKKKEKTRKTLIAENRAILSLIATPNDAGIGWLEQKDSCVFTCFLCSSVIETFSKICDHMENVHPLDEATLEASKEDPFVATHQCIACPKRFKKKSHLKIHLWRHVNKYNPPVTTINDGRGRKGEGSYQKSWLEAQKWICKRCHPPPITKTETVNHQSQKLERFLDPSTGEVIVRHAGTNESSPAKVSQNAGAFNTDDQKLSNDGAMTDSNIKQEKVDENTENRTNAFDANVSVKDNLRTFIRATNEHQALPDDAEVFDGLNSYMAHMQHIHGEPLGFVCPICGKKQFARRDHFRTHVSTHNNQKLPCEFCGKTFADNNKRRRHVIEVHEQRKNHMCNTCGKCFARMEKLRAHEVVHRPEEHKPYLCHQCGKGFARQEQVNRHAKMCGLKPFTCPLCGKGFGRQEHVSRHTKICGKITKKKLKSSLKKDNRIPRDIDKEMQALAVELGVDNVEKDIETGLYQCLKCPSQFKNKRYITEHYARHHHDHYKGLPYKCEKCGKGFKINKDLQRHRKRPHNEDYLSYKIVCPEPGCGKRFRKELGLKRHLLLHRGVRNFKCDKCDMSFHIRQTLRSHYKGIHNLELPPSSANRGPESIETDGTSDQNNLTDVSTSGKIKGKKGRKKKNTDADDKGVLNLSNDLTPESRNYAFDSSWPNQSIQNDCLAGQNIQRTAVHGNISTSSVPIQWPNIDVGNQRPQIALSTATSLKGSQQIAQSSMVGQNYNFNAVQPGNLNQLNPMCRGNESFLNLPVTTIAATIPGIGLSYTAPQKTINNQHESLLPGRGWQPPSSNPQIQVMNQINIDRLKQEHQINDPKFIQIVNKPNVLPSNPELTDNQAPPSNLIKRKKHENQKVLEDHEKEQIVQEMTNNKLGEMCHVCYKIFRNKDALEFHIMNTKMPGHELLVQEKVKNNAASTPQHANLEMAMPSLDEPSIDVIKGIFDSSETNTQIDAKVPIMSDDSSGVTKSVKQEPSLENELHVQPSSILNDSEQINLTNKSEIYSKGDQNDCGNTMNQDTNEVSLKQNSIAQTENLSLLKTATIDCNESTLMPPPSATIIAKKKSSINKIFKCFECNRAFKNDWKLIRHVSRKHSGKKKSSKISIEKVVSHSIKTNAYSTQNEDIETNTSENDVKHPSKTDTLTQNGGSAGKDDTTASLKFSPMGCPDCVVLFPTQDLMMQHFSRSPHRLMCNLNVNKCPVLTCDVSFSTKSKLLDHLVAGKHGQPCPQCGKDFPKLDKLELHIRSHSTDRPFQCPQCFKTYKDATALSSHMLVHSGKRPHLCSECGVGFMKADHLRRHINSTHLKIKNIKCSFCDKMFSDKYKCKIHERRHTGEKPYLCPVCAKGFKRKEALDNHAVTHMDVPKDFKCVTCGACFKSQQYLNRHINRHFAEKKWKCKDCDMAFIDNRDLKVHVRHVHENFRPFECETCHQAYKTKQGLSTHQKAHPNGECINLKKTSLNTEDTDGGAEAKSIIEEKPFGCPECKKRFTKKSRMESHLRTHSNESKFSCSIEGCGKSFTQNQSLRQHMKQIHNLQFTSTSTVSTTGTTIDPPTLPSQETTLSQNLPNHNSSNINQVLSDADMNIRHVKQENQVQPLITQLSQQSSLNINLPQSKVVNLNTKVDDDLQGSGRDSVMSHLSDMSTNSRSSVVVVEPRNQQITHQTKDMVQKTNCSSNSLLQSPLQQLNSISQSQSSVTAQLAGHNTAIPSVAAKAAEAVFGSNTVINNAGDHLRDMRQGATGSWVAGAQANQHSTTIGVSPTTSQFMPLNLQEALVQHQQQNPRLISSAITQVRSPSSLQESASTVSAAVVPNQHQSTTFHHMIQQQQQLLIQQQQQQEEHQRRLTVQKDQRERERLLRERQVREHERQQREQQEHYQRYQLHQQQQLLQQQQQLAAAQAAAQVQQAQVQQSVIGCQQAPSANPSAAGAMFANVPREVDSQQLSAANLDFYQHYAANIANFHPAYRN